MLLPCLRLDILDGQVIDPVNSNAMTPQPYGGIRNEKRV